MAITTITIFTITLILLSPPLTQDIGGQDKIRPLWRHYYAGTRALIFVLDSHDASRLPEARLELHRILRDPEMRGCPLLVLANKQDLSGAMSEKEIIEGLGLEEETGRRGWRIQKACAIEGRGLWEGLEWLVRAGSSGSSKKK